MSSSGVRDKTLTSATLADKAGRYTNSCMCGLMVNYRGNSEVAHCVNTHSECRNAAFEKKGERRKRWCWRGVKRGMWVESCEILRMTSLKLDMSDSNTITIKLKGVEIHTYPQNLIRMHRKTQTQIALVKRKLLREPTVRSCAQKAVWSYWFDRTRNRRHAVTFNETTVL